MRQRKKSYDLTEITISMTIILGLLILFLYCYFGKIATECFENMADALYEADWQDSPIELQKFFILMIGNAQQPLHYHGFLANLKMETFANVSERCGF